MPERFKVVFTMQGAIQVLGFTENTTKAWHCICCMTSWCLSDRGC